MEKQDHLYIINIHIGRFTVYWTICMILKMKMLRVHFHTDVATVSGNCVCNDRFECMQSVYTEQTPVSSGMLHIELFNS